MILIKKVAFEERNESNNPCPNHYTNHTIRGAGLVRLHSGNRCLFRFQGVLQGGVLRPQNTIISVSLLLSRLCLLRLYRNLLHSVSKFMACTTLVRASKFIVSNHPKSHRYFTVPASPSKHLGEDQEPFRVEVFRLASLAQTGFVSLASPIWTSSLCGDFDSRVGTARWTEEKSPNRLGSSSSEHVVALGRLASRTHQSSLSSKA